MEIKSKNQKIKFHEQILSLSLIYTFTFVAIYCIFIFGPIFMTGRTRSSKQMGYDMMDWTSHHQLLIILITGVVSMLILMYYIYRQTVKKEIISIYFDDKLKEISVKVRIYLKNVPIEFKFKFDDIKFTIIKYIDEKKLDRIKIDLKTQNNLSCYVDTNSYYWENNPAEIKILFQEIGKRFPQTEIITKNIELNSIQRSLFIPNNKSSQL